MSFAILFENCLSIFEEKKMDLDPKLLVPGRWVMFFKEYPVSPPRAPEEMKAILTSKIIKKFGTVKIDQVSFVIPPYQFSGPNRINNIFLTDITRIGGFRAEDPYDIVRGGPKISTKLKTSKKLKKTAGKRKGKKRYFHISVEDFGEEVKFTPRKNPELIAPDIARISVAPTVGGCVAAIGSGFQRSKELKTPKGVFFFVYELQGSPIMAEPKGETDAHITKEMWVMEPAIFKKMDTVMVDDPIIKQEVSGDSILDDVGDMIVELDAGEEYAFDDQKEIMRLLRPLTTRLSSTSETNEEVDNEDEEGIRTVPAPMNFGMPKNRKRKKQ